MPLLLTAYATLAPAPAQAVDGCLVLLCLAAPNWRAVPQCVPSISQLLRDLARGKSFPSCAMAGGNGSASHARASAPDFCPPQYAREWNGRNGPRYTCDYAGAISVSVNGAPFARTWWSRSRDTVTDFSTAAKAQLGAWDGRFDDHYAAWLAFQPPASSSSPAR